MMGHYRNGDLIIIGGAEDKYGESSILEEVVDIVGGEDARIGILTTATNLPEEVGEEYRDIFLRLGVKEAYIIDINTRDEANLEENVRRIMDVTGFFFTGGDQLRITSILEVPKPMKRSMIVSAMGSRSLAPVPELLLCAVP